MLQSRFIELLKLLCQCGLSNNKTKMNDVNLGSDPKILPEVYTLSLYFGGILLLFLTFLLLSQVTVFALFGAGFPLGNLRFQLLDPNSACTKEIFPYYQRLLYFLQIHISIRTEITNTLKMRISQLILAALLLLLKSPLIKLFKYERVMTNQKGKQTPNNLSRHKKNSE